MYIWLATFLTGLVEWVLKKFSDKAYMITVAAAFSLLTVSTALIIAGLFVPKVVPESVKYVLSIIAPADWYAQLTIFIYIRATTFSFFQLRHMYQATANISYRQSESMMELIDYFVVAAVVFSYFFGYMAAG